MSSRWRIVDLCDWNNKIYTSRGCLVVNEEKIYLDDVLVILVGVGTLYSGAVNALAAKYDIPILTVDWRSIPIACTFGWSNNSRVAARHLAQANLSQPRKKNAWMQIVRAKIIGQAANMLSTSRKVGEELLKLAKLVKSGDVTNVEARAARTYWSHYCEGEGFSRDSQSIYGRNAMLNYAYAILRGTVIAAICEAGLWPTLGLWHRNRSNPFALADDLIEPFRPIADYVVSKLPATVSLDDKDIKKYLVEIVSLPFVNEGHSVGTEIKQLARHVAMYIEGDISKLPVNHWTPPSG